jgi:N-acetylneuraminic acid mutarotase
VNSTGSDFSGVKILRKVGSYPTGPTDGTAIYDSLGTSYTDTGLTNGTTYYYKAYAHDEVPNYASGAQVSAMPDGTPPGNITAFTVTQGTNNGEITGSWTNPSDSDFVGVRFRYRTDGTFPTSATDGTLLGDKTDSPGTAGSITWTGLNPETTYQIKGFAYDAVLNYASGTSASSGIKPKDLTPPSNVASFTATAGDSQVSLSWTNPSVVDFAGVKVVRKTGGYPTSPTDGVVIYDSTGTGFTDTGLNNGTTYYYKAYAYDEVPNYASGVQASAVPADVAPPGNITAFTVTQGTNNGEIMGSWTNPSDSDFVGVRFRYRTDGVFPTSVTNGILLGDKTGSPGATDSITWTGLNPETTYYIRGFAYDEVPNYALGTSASSGIKPRDLTPPANVASFVAAAGDSQATLSWTNPTDSDFAGVKILRKTGGYPTSPADGTVVYNGTGTGYTDTGLTNGTIYYYAAFTYDEVPNYSSGAQASATLTVIVWATRASMPTARRHLAVGVVGGKIYAIGGWNGGGLATVEEYDPTTNTWTNCGTPAPGNGCAPMPTGRYALAVGVVNDKIYAIGGHSGSILPTVVEEYDPATNAWTNCGTPAPGNGCASIPTAREWLTVGVVGGKIYAIGGTSGGSFLTTVEEYNPATNTWTTKTPMLTGRSGLAVGVVNNKIYAIGGSDGSNYLTTVEEYDPTTDTWAMKTAMPTSRAYLAVGVVNNRIYAIGGWNGSSYFTTVEEYGSATNQWLTKAPMSTGRSSLAVGVMNNKIYAIGGVGSPGETLLNVVEEATISP